MYLYSSIHCFTQSELYTCIFFLFFLHCNLLFLPRLLTQLKCMTKQKKNRDYLQKFPGCFCSCLPRACCCVCRKVHRPVSNKSSTQHLVLVECNVCNKVYCLKRRRAIWGNGKESCRRGKRTLLRIQISALTVLVWTNPEPHLLCYHLNLPQKWQSSTAHLYQKWKQDLKWLGR